LKTYSYFFIVFTIIFLFIFSLLLSQNESTYRIILIETDFGNIKIKLYNETPLHRNNFIKLISENFYNGTFFHRVINGFMIQGGDPTSKNAGKEVKSFNGSPGYTIPAEFNRDLFHKNGAIAAARQGDNLNPLRESSGSQFYIVQGRPYTNKELDNMEQNNLHIKFTEEQRRIYTILGGTPHLDYSYTVFGEVIEGIDIVDKIASTKTDKYDRPIIDIKMIIKIFK